MKIHHLESPEDSTSIIGDRHAEERLWLILGHAYTTDPAAVAYARRKGYTVTEVEQIPSEYLDQSARLDALRFIVLGFDSDAADPDHRYKFRTPTPNRHGQSTFDIRDFIAGRVTKEDLA